MDFSTALAKLIDYASRNLMLRKRNEIYARTTVLMLLGRESCEVSAACFEGEALASLLDVLTEEIPAEERERVQDAVMGAVMLPPAEVEDEFNRRYAVSPVKATEWLYDYSVASDYVKKQKLDRNPRFTGKNGLIVTINRAKPEFRDPKKAMSGNSVRGGYPKCSICRDNEGYFPRGKRTLRTVSFTLGDGKWFWQFSPYGYFYQHGIAVNERHTPMHVDEGTFAALIEFVDAFPHYFIGCNAALPSIGGSVLAHDHFQGGGERLPMFDAKIAVPLRHAAFPTLEIGVLDWYNSVIRIRGRDAHAVIQALNDGIEALASTLHDTLFVITADHGQTDVKETVEIYRDDELLPLLAWPPSLEARATAFKVKKGCREEFRTRFRQKYGADFELVETETLLRENYFGGNIAAHAALLGDFIAIGRTDKIMKLRPRGHDFLGHHTSLTREEMLVPLILIGNK